MGMKVTRNRQKGIIVLNQEQYINKSLTHFGMEDCKGASTPMPLHVKLERFLMITVNTL
jgi:hypothetical protein